MGKPGQQALADSGHWRLAVRVFVAAALLGFTPVVFPGPLYEVAAFVTTGNFGVDEYQLGLHLRDRDLLARSLRERNVPISVESLVARMTVVRVGNNVRVTVRTRDLATGQAAVEALAELTTQHVRELADERWALQQQRWAQLSAVAAALTEQIDFTNEALRVLMAPKTLGGATPELIKVLQTMVKDRAGSLDSLSAQLAQYDADFVRLSEIGLKTVEVKPLSPWPPLLQRAFVALMVGFVAAWIAVIVVESLQPVPFSQRTSSQGGVAWPFRSS